MNDSNINYFVVDYDSMSVIYNAIYFKNGRVTLMKTSKFAWWFAQTCGFIGGLNLIKGIYFDGSIYYIIGAIFFILYGIFQITHEVLAKKGY